MNTLVNEREKEKMKKEGCGRRSESEKEKTKMRERQRRAITTNIFNGLRKHGGYRLSPRADINEVLRELAKEAGWVVHPDGTTYRSKVMNRCPLCGSRKTNSVVMGGGGECLTAASPGSIRIGDTPNNINGGSSSLLCFPEGFSARDTISLPVVYNYQRLAGETQSAACSGSDGGYMTTYEQQGQVVHLQGVKKASNQNKAGGSPLQIAEQNDVVT